MMGSGTDDAESGVQERKDHATLFLVRAAAAMERAADAGERSATALELIAARLGELLVAQPDGSAEPESDDADMAELLANMECKEE